MHCKSPYINSSFFLIASVFCLSSAREWVEWRFLVSNVPAGERTLCHGQHVARELRLEDVSKSVISEATSHFCCRNESRQKNYTLVNTLAAIIACTKIQQMAHYNM